MAQAAGYSFNPSTVVGTTVRDLSGEFLDGSILGSAAITTGKYGDGLNCTGGAMQVTVPPFTQPLDVTGGMTVAAWVKLNTTAAEVRCIASAATAGTLNWALYASAASGNVQAEMMGATYTTSVSIRDGAWHHVILIFDLRPNPDVVKIVVDGVQASITTVATPLAYANANTVVEAGRNALTGLSPLDGVIDDLRWWGDPIEDAAWAGVIAAEQIDNQLAIYPFDDDTANDFGSYGRHLTKAASATYDYGVYGRALVGSGTEAAASGTINCGAVDRLSLTGWMRLDQAPVGAAAPITTITDTAGNPRARIRVNTDNTVTATWNTLDDGIVSVTHATPLVVGAWTRYNFHINPTYVSLRIGTSTETLLSIGDGIPHLAPVIAGIDVLYVGGDATTGARVSFDYMTLTRNYINENVDKYWSGAPIRGPQRPANLARGVYHFNENTGTVVDDKSPSNNNLTLATAGSWVPGIEGSALGSNGTGPGATGTITWPAAPIGWAFSMWVKVRTTAVFGSRFLAMRGAAGDVAHAGRMNGRVWIRLYGPTNNTGAVNPSTGSFATETWTHLAGSCDGKTIQFYKDGAWIASEPYTVGALPQPNQIAVGGDNPEGSVADVDDLRLFDTPISAANVAWLYANIGQFYPTAPGVLEANLPALTGAITGVVGSGAVTGSLASTLPAITGTAAGTVEVTGPALLAAYNFDEASGNVLDVSSQGHGFALSAGTVRTAAGHTNQGLTQDTNLLQVGPAVFGLTANRTMMMWIKSTASVSDGRILEYTATDGNSIWEFLMRDTLWHLQAWNAGTFARATLTRPTDSAWHHLAGTYDGTSLRIYLDGTLMTTTAFAGPLRTDANAFNIFRNSGNPNTIDDVRFYDTALDAATITTLMAQPVDNMTTLDVQSAAHDQTAPTVAFTVYDLLVQPASHTVVVGNVAPTQAHALAVGGAAHSQVADAVNLSTAASLGVQAAASAQAADQVTLTQDQALAVQDAAQAQAADTLALVVALPVDNAVQAQAAEEVALTQLHVLAVDNAAQLQTADPLALFFGFVTDVTVLVGLTRAGTTTGLTRTGTTAGPTRRDRGA